MIAYLKGQIIWQNENKIILKAGNIGYLVELVDPDLSILSDREIELYIYTHVREDALQLYGFKNLADRELFITLIGISGVGPKLALKILSTLPHDRFVDAILNENISLLKQIPGVGLKTAQRLILELKNKMEKLAVKYDLETAASSYDEDLYNALAALGYSQGEIDRALKEIDLADLTGIEDKLKVVLSYLGKGI
ncbi:MAG: Holliday junction branch migration protein RuvA [Halanaerobiales bacterium]